MTVMTFNVASLKAVKNAVIGNRTAKGNYGRDEVFVSRCVQLTAQFDVTGNERNVQACRLYQRPAYVSRRSGWHQDQPPHRGRAHTGVVVLWCVTVPFRAVDPS